MELSTRELAIAYWNSGRMKISQYDSAEKYYKGRNAGSLKPEEIEFIYISEMAEKGETVEKLYSRKEVEDILLEFAKDCGKDESLYSHYAGDYRDLKQWIKDTL